MSPQCDEYIICTHILFLEIVSIIIFYFFTFLTGLFSFFQQIKIIIIDLF